LRSTFAAGKKQVTVFASTSTITPKPSSGSDSDIQRWPMMNCFILPPGSDKCPSLNQDITKCHLGVKGYDEKILLSFDIIYHFYGF
jgi:hypothetical protein